MGEGKSKIEAKALKVYKIVDLSEILSDEMIEADFSSMSIVFKNLIDNAHKYGENLEIKVDDGSLVERGTPILSVEAADEGLRNLEAMIYVPTIEGKKI